MDNKALENAKKEKITASMQVEYFKSAVNDFEIMLKEKKSQLMQHIDCVKSIDEKIIKILEEINKELEEKK